MKISAINNVNTSFKGHYETALYMDPKGQKNSADQEYEIIGKRIDANMIYMDKKNKYGFLNCRGYRDATFFYNQENPGRRFIFNDLSYVMKQNRHIPPSEFEKTYVADPNEIIPSEVYDNAKYVALDLEPVFPTLDTIRNKYTSRDGDSRNLFQELDAYKEYHTRSIDADKRRAFAADNTIKKFYEKYSAKDIEELDDACERCTYGSMIEKDQYKIDRVDCQTAKFDKERAEKRIQTSLAKIAAAQELEDVIAKSGKEFLYRDAIVNYTNKLREDYKLTKLDLETTKNNIAKINKQNLNYNAEIATTKDQEKVKHFKEEIESNRRRLEYFNERKAFYENELGRIPAQVQAESKKLEIILRQLISNYMEVKEHYEKNHLELI